MRDYLKESGDVLHSSRPLRQLLTEDRAALLALLVKHLSSSDIYQRKYAAFCLGQLGDATVSGDLGEAFQREPEGGAKDAMAAAIATLREFAGEQFSEAQRCEFQEEAYSQGIPEWIRQIPTMMANKPDVSALVAKAEDIFDQLVAIQDSDGKSLEIKEYTPAWEEGFVQRFRYKRIATHASHDPAVVSVVRERVGRGESVRIAGDGERYFILAKAAAGQEQPGKSGGCFVATAACGDPAAPEVQFLSAFRDEVSAQIRCRSIVRLGILFGLPSHLGLATDIVSTTTRNAVVCHPTMRACHWLVLAQCQRQCITLMEPTSASYDTRTTLRGGHSDQN